MKRILLPLLALLTATPLFTGCNDDNDDAPADPAALPGVTLSQTATSQVQWTGVAVLRDGRLFANFPRMETDTIPYSVAEIQGQQAIAFPDTTWNNWKPSLPAQNRFVCVQSVYTDANNFLWVLDAASPQMRGVVRNGAKLLKFDPNTRQLIQRVDFDETVVYPTSYLNDVRIDTERNYAYITDSNQGAIIVVNLATGRSRRLLGNHPSTKSENLILTVEGRVWRNRSGKLPSIDSDGLALSPDREFIYYHALTARTLYRIRTQYLRDEALPASQLGQRVELVGDTGPTDGMLFDPSGNLYFTTFELNAVTRLTPDGQFQVIARDPQLKWPDSFSLGPDGALYVTTSQLHIPRSQRTEPFQIFKITLPQ
ncbi:major royal jelly family protein [Hymenobacter tibetensis]|uniref:Major royal jelly family protein n=1 Tax=Hymenobacter tibetensis TaxID=497967 RepID=A0ABY4CWJ2_9BACT|nr:major royal jelly family protein [Hymenobacter tibetensis]UOG74620.1 major royal jelly family protein [Hymenobacter tibetensis]